MKSSEPFVGMIKRTTKGDVQEEKLTTHKRRTFSHSIKALYVRVVKSA